MPDSIIRIDDDTIIRSARVDDAQEAFELIESNREHLKGLNRMSHIQSIEDERAFLGPEYNIWETGQRMEAV